MTPEGFVIRDARPDDVDALARLHVETFIETHGGPGPSVEIRASQWKSLLEQDGGDHFCLVVIHGNGELVGFARGIPYTDGGVPGYAGELNKIYVRRKYHRLGLGSTLVGHVARRFLENGVDSMLLFGDSRSPSNGFYERLGAERLYSPEREFHGGYGWRDLKLLVEHAL